MRLSGNERAKSGRGNKIVIMIIMMNMLFPRQIAYCLVELIRLRAIVRIDGLTTIEIGRFLIIK